MAPLLYKKVMQLATLDSTATNATLGKNILKCTQYSITCGGDVDETISYININYFQLKAHEKVMVHAVKAFSNGIEDNNFKTGRCRMVSGIRQQK